LNQDVLRDYQQNAVKLIFNSWREQKKKPLLCLPTGAGKTHVATYIVNRFVEQGRKVLFITHRRELVEQATGRFRAHGIDAGQILPGCTPNRKQLAVVASVQSLIRRETPDCDLMIVDECHHALSKSFLQVLDKHLEGNGRILGLTATPYRLDGRPLGLVFDDLLIPVTVSDLIDRGHLVQPRYFGAKREGLEDIKKIAGEYSSSQMFQKFNKPALYANAVKQYREFCGGKALVFCVNVEHSIATAAAFEADGIRAMHIDGTTPLQARKRILNMFRAGSVRVLCNCNLFTEGFDLPDIEGVILNRMTASKCLYTQMVGRVLRPSDGKEHGVIVDMGNNVLLHGFVEDLHEYSLEGKKKQGDGVAPVKTCPACQSIIHASAKVCPKCGKVFEVAEKEEIEAPFAEIKRIPVPEHLRKRFFDMTQRELWEYAELKNYKPGWVRVQTMLQQGKRRNRIGVGASIV